MSDEAGAPSATAMMTAFGRAMHVVLDDPPHLMVDGLAWPLLGAEGDWLLELGATLPEAGVRALRANWLFRALATEQRVLAAVERGLGQYVILGAGLDTFAWRYESVASERGLRVFEVDHPSTQAWKRERLAAIGARTPQSLAFVPVDFSVDDLVGALAARGFEPAAPAFFSWLGVTMYLSRESALTTLRAIAGLAPGTAVCLTYGLPELARSGLAREVYAAGKEIVAGHGEPWVSFYLPDEIEALVREAGFTTVEHIGDDEVARLFAHRGDGLMPTGAERLLVAST